MLSRYYYTLFFSDGVGRTGTFICIHAQLERIKTEGVVDVFQFVKSSRISRPNLVSELVSDVTSSPNPTNTTLTHTLSMFTHSLSLSLSPSLSLSLQEYYIFCHQSLADFLDTFDTYANFKDLGSANL